MKSVFNFKQYKTVLMNSIRRGADVQCLWQEQLWANSIQEIVFSYVTQNKRRKFLWLNNSITPQALNRDKRWQTSMSLEPLSINPWGRNLLWLLAAVICRLHIWSGKARRYDPSGGQPIAQSLHWLRYTGYYTITRYIEVINNFLP
jgi:hypothetical protein